ncbi:MAG TPA: sensor histidine kinase, partial [Candidatus Dormibacteraeota bacterium]|nr:sensor histidine kinase [Candidatus Dormibacteraeota bacterium]
GAGIPPDLLPHVFERFAKGPNSTGSGLGLAIAHEIVSAHGGQLLLTPSNPTGVSATVVLRSG